MAQAVRSPLAFLDRLADEHEKSKAEEEGESDEVAGAPLATGPPSESASDGNGVHGGAAQEVTGAGSVRPAIRALPVEFDDPSMN